MKSYLISKYDTIRGVYYKTINEMLRKSGCVYLVLLKKLLYDIV